MRKVLFISLFILPFFSVQPMVRAGVEVPVTETAESPYAPEPYVDIVWSGPGWYYGFYFDDPMVYRAWYRNYFIPYQGVVETVWVGPGWYYGFWFDSEIGYHTWYRRHYHRYHGWRGRDRYQSRDGRHYNRQSSGSRRSEPRSSSRHRSDGRRSRGHR